MDVMARGIRGKKGQDLTIGTVVLIVIGLVVLFGLFFGFSPIFTKWFSADKCLKNNGVCTDGYICPDDSIPLDGFSCPLNNQRCCSKSTTTQDSASGNQQGTMLGIAFKDRPTVQGTLCDQKDDSFNYVNNGARCTGKNTRPTSTTEVCWEGSCIPTCEYCAKNAAKDKACPSGFTQSFKCAEIDNTKKCGELQSQSNTCYTGYCPVANQFCHDPAGYDVPIVHVTVDGTEYYVEPTVSDYKLLKVTGSTQKLSYGQEFAIAFKVSQIKERMCFAALYQNDLPQDKLIWNTRELFTINSTTPHSGYSGAYVFTGTCPTEEIESWTFPGIPIELKPLLSNSNGLAATGMNIKVGVVSKTCKSSTDFVCMLDKNNWETVIQYPVELTEVQATTPLLPIGDTSYVCPFSSCSEVAASGKYTQDQICVNPEIINCKFGNCGMVNNKCYSCPDPSSSTDSKDAACRAFESEADCATANTECGLHCLWAAGKCYSVDYPNLGLPASHQYREAFCKMFSSAQTCPSSFSSAFKCGWTTSSCHDCLYASQSPSGFCTQFTSSSECNVADFACGAGGCTWMNNACYSCSQLASSPTVFCSKFTDRFSCNNILKSTCAYYTENFCGWSEINSVCEARS